MIDNVIGDFMKIIKLFPYLLAIIIGIYLGKVVIDGYKSKESLQTVFNDSEKYYVIEQGVYSSMDELKQNTSKLTYYIYNEEDGLFYVYLGITKNKDNQKKLSSYFKELGYEVHEKEIFLDNKNFSNVINDYDEMLKKTTDKNAIKTIYLQVLSKYNELVISDEY